MDGHLLRELGERLVARPSIALAELVKNSFDADATEVTLRFSDIREKGGKIEVEDNGNGMSIDSVENTWMKIATRDKRKNPNSPLYNRVRAGEKGVGRFACQVIADILILESICLTKRGKEKITAKFDWERYWSREKLEDTRVDFSVEKAPKDAQVGTKLTLLGTKKAWTKKEIGSMRRDILSLINPFSWEKSIDLQESDADPGFDVIFEIPEFEEFSGGFSNYYLQAAWCILEGEVNSKGKVIYKIESITGAKESLTHPFDDDFRIGPLSFRIYWFRRKADEYKEFEFGIREIQNAGKVYGGVRVYYDDFRVFPYGEHGDDWLNVEKDRAARKDTAPKNLADLGKGLFRPMLLTPANNQLVGAVFLSRNENPEVIISVTRDRLVENDVFIELRKIMRTGIQWMTLIYARESEEVRRVDRESKKSHTTIQEIQDIVSVALETADTEEKAETLRTLQDLTISLEEEMKEEEEEIIAIIDLYQVLASTGTIVGILGHELLALKEALQKSRLDIEKISKEVPIRSRVKLQEITENLLLWHRFIDELSKTVRQLLSKESRDQRIKQAIKEAIDVVSDAFGSYCEHNKVDIQNKVPANLVTPPMFLAQLYSIIANLLTNAMKWVMFTDDRRIEFGGRKTSTGVEFWILDSGLGVQEEIRTKVFKPFVSYSTPNLDLGTGTGLGLTIVKNFVEDAHGTVEFLNPPDDWGTYCLMIFEDVD